MSVTRDLIVRARELHGNLPADVLESARLHFLDALGVGAHGARKGPLTGLGRVADPLVGGTATVLGSPLKAPAAVAALINGSYIHSLEFDDTHVGSVMHGSATVAAAALAVAQESGADGATMISAYALGWELLIHMGLASPGTLQARGFQTTSAAGPFAAALVSVLIRDDDLDVAVSALGIAGSQPGGTFAFLDEGNTVKAGQPGWAAHSGLWAADLARAGMTGPSRVLEGPRGFFQLYADDPGAAQRLSESLERLGEPWHLPQAAYKLIPCCHFIHPFVEALGTLLDGDLVVADIERIHCFVPAGAAPIIAEPWADRQQPRTPHDARWSLPYVLAGRAVDGAVTLDLFNTPVEGQRLDLSRRITHEIWADSGFPARFPARIEVTTRDGRVLVSEIEDVLGGATRPVPRDQVLAKAVDNLSGAGLSPESVDAVIAEFERADGPDLAELSTLLTA